MSEILEKSVEINRVNLQLQHIFFSSTLSGMVVTFVATPFDVVKNYWIYNPCFQNSRTTIRAKDVIRTLYMRGGIPLLYSGYGVACLTHVPGNLIFFFAYEYFIKKHNPALAGVSARLMAVTLTAPGEYIKTALQTNAGLKVRDIFESRNFSSTARLCGQGLVATFWRDVPFSAIYWILNEKGKTWLYNNYNYNHKSSNFIYPFLSGAFSAMIASTLTHPFDVIKTVIQGQRVQSKELLYKNMKVHTVGQAIWKRSGFNGFFVGLTPRLVKIVPSCALLLASYDFSKAIFSNNLK